METSKIKDTARTFPPDFQSRGQNATAAYLSTHKNLRGLINYLRGNQTEPCSSKPSDLVDEYKSHSSDSSKKYRSATLTSVLDSSKSGDTEEEKSPSDIYITNDPCPHCATQGLSISARNAKINYRLGDALRGLKMSPFMADIRCKCEFPYRIKCFLTDPAAWSVKRLEKLTSCLTDLTSAQECTLLLQKKVRVLIRLNDHLRKEEGVRGWVLIVEGTTQEAVTSTLQVIEKRLVEENIIEIAEGADV